MLRQNYKNRDVSQITFKEMAISGLLNSYNESQNAESFLSLKEILKDILKAKKETEMI